MNAIRKCKKIKTEKKRRNGGRTKIDDLKETKERNERKNVIKTLEE